MQRRVLVAARGAQPLEFARECRGGWSIASCSATARCSDRCRNGLTSPLLGAVVALEMPLRRFERSRGIPDAARSARAAICSSAGQRLACAVLAPGVDQEAARLVARWAEHGGQGFRRVHGAASAHARVRLRRGVLCRYSHRSRITHCGHFGRARDAHVAAVQDQPVVRVLPELVGHELREPALDLDDVLARREAACGSRRGRCACRRRSSARRTRCSARRWPSCGRRRAALRAPRGRAALRRRARRSRISRQRDDVLRLGAEEADRADVGRSGRRRRAATIACGRVGDRKSLRVALLTPLSVACADSTTATSSSNGVRYVELGRRMRVAGAQALEDRAALLRVRYFSASRRDRARARRVE